MGRSFLSLIAVFLLAAAPAAAQDWERDGLWWRRRSESAPEPGFAARLARLEERLEQRRVELHVPGMAVAVVAEDQVVLARGFGYRDLERRLPAGAETVFPIGSATKAFTATLIGMLVDERKMSWDDPVRQHLPWFRLKDEEADARVTVRDLLCHRTGLTRTGLLWLDGGVSRQRALRQLADAEPWAPFRTRFLYNNLLYAAAAECASAAAGEDWEVLLFERLFLPLGMDSASISTEETRADPRLAQGYEWIPGEDRWLELAPRDVSIVAAAAGISATALDMTQWLRLMLGQGRFQGRRLISRAQLRTTLSPQIQAGAGSAYGLGWSLSTWNDRRIVEHGGNVDGYCSQLAFIPEENLGFVLLTNVSATALQAEAIPLVFDTLLGPWHEPAGAEPAPPGPPLAAAEYGRYVGAYRVALMKHPLRFRVRELDGVAVPTLEVPWEGMYELNWPDRDGKWRFQDSRTLAIEFVTQGPGAAAALLLWQGAVPKRYPRLYPPTPPISVDALMELRQRGHGSPWPAHYPRLRLRGRVSLRHSGLSGRYTAVLDGRDRWAETLEFGEFGSMRSVVDGERAWTDHSFQPRRTSTAAAREQWLSLHPARIWSDWRALYDEIQVLRAEERGEREVYVVRVVPRHAPPEFRYVDAASGLLLEIELLQVIGTGSLPTTYRFEDYRRVHGIRIPHRIIMESETSGHTVIEIEEVEWQPELTPADFSCAHPARTSGPAA